MNAQPGRRCLQMAYLNRLDATDAKREIVRRHGIETQLVFCESCSKYHLRCETWPPIRQWREILILMARGFRAREIANTLGITQKAVHWAVYSMEADWHALSSANLISIVTSFGVIVPEEFLLLDEDVARYRARDTKKAEYTDAV